MDIEISMRWVYSDVEVKDFSKFSIIPSLVTWSSQGKRVECVWRERNEEEKLIFYF